MRLVLYILATILIQLCHGGMILHNIRDSLHSKLYGHGLHGDNQNSPVININNYQEVSQQTATTNQHSRGDYGPLPGYDQQMHSSDMGNGFINSNVKAGVFKYGRPGIMGGYDGHSSMKQESYHHRQGPKFGLHHDTNMFGNTKIGSASSAASSSAASLFGSAASSTATSSSSSSASASSSSSSSSSSTGVAGGTSYYNTRVKPWRY
uniref:Uncharacterized protein n=1 Tax=Stomoxys calcitrans TaxID=35570 RepID=A0A1I8Q6N1_STOCA